MCKIDHGDYLGKFVQVCPYTFCPMSKHFLTINEVAELLGISTKTLRRWEANGLISPHRTIGNQRRYSFEDVDKLKMRRVNSHYSKIIISPKTTLPETIKN